MRKEAINKIIGWSEEAINVAEIQATGAPIDTGFLFKELKEVIIYAKKAGLTLDDVKEHIWSYDELAERIYNEIE